MKAPIAMFMAALQAVKLLLVLLDCILNLVLGGSINETLSSRAHRIREKHQPYFFWAADAIDWVALHIFNQPDHCRVCNKEETASNGALYWLGLSRT